MNKCDQTHRALVRGRCPWCGRYLANGEPISDTTIRANFTSLRHWRQSLDPLLDQGAISLEDIDDVLEQLVEFVQHHRSKLVRIFYDGTIDRWRVQQVES